MYSLVIITALNIAAISSFDTLTQCKDFQKSVPNSTQLSTVCIPTSLPQAVRNKVDNDLPSTSLLLLAILQQMPTSQ